LLPKRGRRAGGDVSGTGDLTSTERVVLVNSPAWPPERQLHASPASLASPASPATPASPIPSPAPVPGRCRAGRAAAARLTVLIDHFYTTSPNPWSGAGPTEPRRWSIVVVRTTTMLHRGGWRGWLQAPERDQVHHGHHPPRSPDAHAEKPSHVTTRRLRCARLRVLAGTAGSGAPGEVPGYRRRGGGTTTMGRCRGQDHYGAPSWWLAGVVQAPGCDQVHHGYHPPRGPGA
jgi:hypothetical protein